MAKEFAKKFYSSKAWLKCRELYIQNRIQIDGGMCETCRERLGYIVHHKVKLTPQNINNPEIALNHKLLKYDCKPCHDEEHYKDMHGTERKEPRCVFDPDGQPMERREAEQCLEEEQE